MTRRLIATVLNALNSFFPRDCLFNPASKDSAYRHITSGPARHAAGFRNRLDGHQPGDSVSREPDPKLVLDREGASCVQLNLMPERCPFSSHPAPAPSRDQTIWRLLRGPRLSRSNDDRSSVHSPGCSQTGGRPEPPLERLEASRPSASAHKQLILTPSSAQEWGSIVQG